MDAVKEAIQAKENIYAQAQTAGVDEANLALFTEDAISMENDEHASIGKEALKKSLKEAAARREM